MAEDWITTAEAARISGYHPEYQAIELEPSDRDEISVVAELIKVLGGRDIE
jgi:hypothetical protein